ncbi:MAG: porin family protein [Candidatus Zixiibacteriota bacterium]
MGKIILTLAITAVLVSNGLAADDFNLRTSKGFKCGLNMAGINSEGLDMKGDGAFGIFVNHPLSPRFAVQPELLYVVNGSSGGFFSYDYDLNLIYIEIPVLFQYPFATWGRFVPHLTAGPEIGFLVSAENKGEDVSDEFKSTDFGFVYGLGFKILFNNNNGLTFDINITNGLTNVFDTEDDEGENESCSFMFGYFF